MAHILIRVVQREPGQRALRGTGREGVSHGCIKYSTTVELHFAARNVHEIGTRIEGEGVRLARRTLVGVRCHERIGRLASALCSICVRDDKVALPPPLLEVKRKC